MTAVLFIPIGDNTCG